MGTMVNIPATVTESSQSPQFTCNQSTQSIVYVQDTDIALDFFQLEREGPVYQFDSVVQETMKLLMLIENAVVDIHLFTRLKKTLKM